MIKTLEDIEKELIEMWRLNCRKEVFAQILLNKLKKDKVLTRIHIKKIQEKINSLGKQNMEDLKK